MRSVVEVVFALPDEQVIETVSFEVLPRKTIEAAIEYSGILKKYPHLKLTALSVGIFSTSKQLSDQINPGDRVEIYRPLTIDPMEKRRKLAKKQSLPRIVTSNLNNPSN